MPPVKNLTDEKKNVNVPASATPSTPRNVPTVQTSTTDNPPSYGQTNHPLTESKGNQELVKSATGVSIPSFLQQQTLPEVEDRTSGYVGFASSASKNWAVQQMNGMSEGQPFIYYKQQYLPCDSLQFFLLIGQSFQTIMVGKEGKFKYVTHDMSEEFEQIRNNNIIVQGKSVPLHSVIGSSKLEAHYVMMMICVTGNNLIPIKGDFRGTKSGGMEGAIRATEEAAKPSWINLSESTRATAAFPQPWGRVFHSIDTTRHVSRSGPGAGNPYYRANCNSRPAKIEEMQKLVNALQDPAFMEELTAAKQSYDDRIAFLEKIMNEGPQDN
jgi:hypothetical protein